MKAASEVFAPVAGEVVEVNDALADQPGKVNEDAGGRRLVRQAEASTRADLDALMDAEAYKAFLKTI